MGRRTIDNKEYYRPEIGDLVYVLEGIRHKTGIVIAVDGSLWHKHIQDWFYYILMENGTIEKRRGWRVERIQPIKDR